MPNEVEVQLPLRPAPRTNDPASPRWPMSLLWPALHSGGASVTLPSEAVADLALDHIVRALDITGQHARAIRAILCDLPMDTEVIGYRQAILEDLLAAPGLAAEMQAMIPELAALAVAGGSNWPGDSPLVPIMARLRDLDRYVACIDRLHTVLDGATGIRSAGLAELQAAIRARANDPDVCALRTQIPELRDLLGEAKSVTIGLNLDPDLEPESATIVDLNSFQFTGPRSLLGRLLPSTSNGVPTRGALHHAGPKPLRQGSELHKDLQRLLESVATPLARALARYRELQVGALAGLEREFAFFTGGAALIHRLEASGITMCRPEIAPAGERSLVVERTCNLALALQMLHDHPQGLGDHLVLNDAEIVDGSRIVIVTGPNRGGKTTYCRALGQAQALFQSGLYVAGSSARLSPVDGVWTHFPLPEADRPGGGRLDEEVARLRTIFDGATAASLILLNEPLTSTSERDALPIATDLLRALQLLGARTVLITHLHELALSIPALNENGHDGNMVRSLVAEVEGSGDDIRGTFRIRPGVPSGRSYAAEIARQHGFTFDQLRDLLAERGV